MFVVLRQRWMRRFAAVLALAAAVGAAISWLREMPPPRDDSLPQHHP
jgi:hypothetical protein